MFKGVLYFFYFHICNKVSNRSYVLHQRLHRGISWYEAEQTCQYEGGHLWSVNSHEEWLDICYGVIRSRSIEEMINLAALFLIGMAYTMVWLVDLNSALYLLLSK